MRGASFSAAIIALVLQSICANTRATNKFVGQPRDLPLILWGSSPAVDHARRLVRRYAPLDHPVLIIGSSSADTTAVARAVHMLRAGSSKHLIDVFGTSLRPRLNATSTLFGANDPYNRGLVEGANTEQGTLVLHELHAAQREMQSIVKRFVVTRRFVPLGASEERMFRGRVVATDGYSVPNENRKATLRATLRDALSGFEPIIIPPLSERPEDIGLIAEELLSVVATRYQRADIRFRLSGELRHWLCHKWRGNILDLERRLSRTVFAWDDTNGSSEISVRDILTGPL